MPVYKHYGITVYETSDSIFDLTTQALVNPVNLQGVSGAGLAKQFKQRFPEATTFYESCCKKKSFQLGNVLVYYIRNTSYFRNQETEMIIYFPTKVEWINPSDYGLIEEGLFALASCTLSNRLYSIAIPPIGCGCGGLDKAKVKDMILEIYCPKVAKYLKDLHLPFFV